MADAADEKQDRRRKRGCCLGGCLLWLISLLGAALVVAVLVGRDHPGESAWRSALLIYAPQWPFAILPAVAALWALLARRGGLLIANLVVLWVALFTVADLQIPGPPPATEGRQTIRVMTWNLHAYPYRLEEMCERVEEWDPDILCTQESGAGEFRKLLPDHFTRSGGDLRIFSRYKILRHQHVILEPYPPRVALMCEIETDGGPITVLTVHFPRATQKGGLPADWALLPDYVEGGLRVRETKFEGLLEWLPDDRPLIVAGDMNTPPSSKYYRMLAERMQDAFAARGSGFGHSFVWREIWPLLRIDYVWFSGGIEALSCTTGQNAPSDHRPVISDLVLPRQESATPTAN